MTRAQKAEKLKQLVTNGPSLNLHIFGQPNISQRLTPEQNEAIKACVRRWLDSHVKPLVSDLVAELKGWEQ